MKKSEKEHIRCALKFLDSDDTFHMGIRILRKLIGEPNADYSSPSDKKLAIEAKRRGFRILDVGGQPTPEDEPWDDPNP